MCPHGIPPSAVANSYPPPTIQCGVVVVVAAGPSMTPHPQTALHGRRQSPASAQFVRATPSCCSHRPNHSSVADLRHVVLARCRGQDLSTGKQLSKALSSKVLLLKVLASEGHSLHHRNHHCRKRSDRGQLGQWRVSVSLILRESDHCCSIYCQRCKIDINETINLHFGIDDPV